MIHTSTRKKTHTKSNPTEQTPKKLCIFLPSFVRSFVSCIRVSWSIFAVSRNIHVMQFAKNKDNQLFCEVNAIGLETRTDMFVCAFAHVPRQFSFHFIHVFKNIHRYLKVRTGFFGYCMSDIHTIETKDQGYFRFLWHFKLCGVLCYAVSARWFSFRLAPSLMCENTERNSVAWFWDFLFLAAKISHSLERTAT